GSGALSAMAGGLPDFVHAPSRGQAERRVRRALASRDPTGSASGGRRSFCRGSRRGPPLSPASRLQKIAALACSGRRRRRMGLRGDRLLPQLTTGEGGVSVEAGQIEDRRAIGSDDLVLGAEQLD